MPGRSRESVAARDVLNHGNTEGFMFGIIWRIGVIAFGIAAIIAFSACSGSTGWRVSFGVSPVKQLDDRQQLTQEARLVRR
jgi:hypothetical protein